MIRQSPVLIIVVALTACAGGGLPPVSDRSPNLEKPVFVNGVFKDKSSNVIPASYLVRGGDTLYSIAWRFNRDYKKLARYNAISAPYLIHPGQQLSLSTYAQSASKIRIQTPATEMPRANKPKTNSPSVTHSVTPRNQWRWPAKGKTLREYGKTNAGVDIRVNPGTSIVASAEGEVVYAGRGLRGFEHLIIIKHNEQILSAYGINQSPMVKEGQLVKPGTRLATITATGVAQETLHFEIRKNGNHLNPQTYITKRG